MKKIYRCTDTVTGIFSAIYDVWKAERSTATAGIAFKGTMEQQLFCDYQEVEETEHKAIAVENLIQKHLGYEAYWDIYHAVLAADDQKGNAILGTMLEARKIADSHKIMNHLSHPMVEKVFELSRSVGNEAHLFTGFVRFKELNNQILFAEISPKSQVLTCIAEHFSNRLPLENWMIYDKTHEMFLVHEAKKQWILVWDDDFQMENIPRYSSEEKQFEQLWKGFCSSISIEERKDLKGQKQHLPLHYQRDMVEF